MPISLTIMEWLRTTGQPADGVLILQEPMEILLVLEAAFGAGVGKQHALSRLAWLDTSDPYTPCVQNVIEFAAIACLPMEATQFELHGIMGFVLHVADSLPGADTLSCEEVTLCCEMARLLAIALREHGSAQGIRILQHALDQLVSRLRAGSEARLVVEHRAGWVGVVCTSMEREWAQTLDPTRTRAFLDRARSALDLSRGALAALATLRGSAVPALDDLELRYLSAEVSQELQGLDSRQPFVASRTWKEIMDGYMAVGHEVNAGAAAGMWLQAALRVSRKHRVLNSATMEELEERIRVGSTSGAADRRTGGRLKQLHARALVAMGRLDEAEQVVRAAVSEATGLLTPPADQVLASNVRSAAEDWIGLALLLDLSRTPRVPGDLYTLVHTSIRGRPPCLPPLAPDNQITILLHRWATAAGVREATGNVAWTAGANAEVAWEPMSELLRLSRMDLRKTQERAISGYTEGRRWRRLLRLQADRLGLRQIPSGRTSCVCIDRSDVPLLAMANSQTLDGSRQSRLRIDAVLGRRTNLPGVCVLPPPEAGDPVRFVNMFGANDPMRPHFLAIYLRSRRPGWVWEEPPSVEAFQEAMQSRARGLVVGMHGWITDVLAPGQIDIASVSVASEDVLNGVAMECAPFVVLVTCFAAAGSRNAFGGGTSLVDQFLRVGAHSVVASPFPVFMDGQGRVAVALNEFLQRIDSLPLPRQPVEVARETARMVEVLHEHQLHPRYWAGYGCWTTAAEG